MSTVLIIIQKLTVVVLPRIPDRMTAFQHCKMLSYWNEKHIL